MKTATLALLVLITAISAGGCAISTRGAGAGAEHGAYVGIAGISGDEVLADRLVGVLGAAGIGATYDGSLAYCIYVPSNRRVRAMALLRKDADQHKYWIEFLPK